MNIETVIREKYFEVLDQTGSQLMVPKLESKTLLLQSGLDSLGFAILVASLEEALGFDPFTMMDEPFYPTSFGEFVEIYEKMNPNK
jgi:acyl carrier protein